MTVYSVRMVGGAEFMWTASDLMVASLGSDGFLPLSGGTLINLAHVESLTPVDTVEAEAEAG